MEHKEENVEQRYMAVAQDMGLLAQGGSAGVIYWKPAGLQLYEKLKYFIRAHHEQEGYQEVKSPSLVGSYLFERSGHLQKYDSNMFSVSAASGEDKESSYVVRPMSCPNHMVLYESELRSYRDLPVSFFEFGEVFRNEPSGSLQALFRQRQFCQDDAHVFVDPDNLVASINRYLRMAQKAYKELGFQNIHYALSLRPKERLGEESDWDNAEEALKAAFQEHGIAYELCPGEGAFYGPKIELQCEDKLGRWWQLGTLQLDYVLPKRFNLHYIDKDNEKRVPILLHHAVLGSLERMVGVLLESFGKDIPLFLQPYEGVIVAVSEKSSDYAQLLKKENPHLLLDISSSPLGKKLEHWRQKGVPHIYVVGEKEARRYEAEGVKEAVLNIKDKKEKFLFK